MKKQLLLICLSLFAFIVKTNAQCTPDPNLTTTGFSPAELPYSYVGSPYNEVLSFKAPLDTSTFFNGSLVDVVIDSVIMLDLRGIPANYSYQCLSRCAIPGGGRGCALLTGQGDSSQVGAYRIAIFLATYYHPKGTTFKGSRIDSGDSYQFRIFLPTGLGGIFPANAPVEIKAYPNPTQNNINFDLSSLPHHTSGTYSIIDALGRMVTTGNFTNNLIPAIGVSDYKMGLYKCMIKTDDGVYYTSFIKE
ncbi:MAG: T9SS type A sorting domain-containing protein [Bacteroidia bacterium]|nr:T9SS type A sorting domain-containing protein [Bacteroidia bacterium]MBP9688405.1 T9SS type A sorting domain-containing protein [Bacteroidia bacterium]